MIVQLAYGRAPIEIEVPDTAKIIRPKHAQGLPNESEAIRAALRNPIQSPALTALVKPGDKIVIAHSDITRATPNERILPVILSELESAGIRREDITLLNALGTHRPQTLAELRTMLGDYVIDHYRCLQHDGNDDRNLVSLGNTSFGHPVRLNRILMEADLKILTGFIEPHFFAGFSGGPKGVLPALAGSESVQTNHSYEMIGHPNATWGITEGNPIWEEMREMALKAAPVFLLNVTMNTERQITGVFAGDLLAAHTAGIEFVRSHSMQPVSEPFDVVISTNSGYPLDQNLYQAAKGMRAANNIVRDGGAILMAAACEDGLPAHGQYAQLLAQAGSPKRLLEMLAQPGFSASDQWNAQVQAMIQIRCDVFLYSGGLTDHEIRSALLTPVRNLNQTISELIQRYGSHVAVLPDGPLVIATLENPV